MDTQLPTPAWLEDFAPGQTIRTGTRQVTADDITAFATLTGDENPLHVDAEFAAESRFGERIGHGLLGLSFAMGLLARTGIFEGSSVALLGVEDWRFHAPILIGDTLGCDVEILGVRRTSSGNGVLDRQFTVRNQDDVVVQTGRIGLMVLPRPTTD